MPKESRHRRPVEPAQPQELPAHITIPCLRGDHSLCSGRVALPQVRNGSRFVPCQCPEGPPNCVHPEFRTLPVK
ncbi:hypothetical protein AB0B89_36565 [Sphaerisporangium sp. NPDC049002]|uniref:hypothetical protein n=1 Tax=Sphaerisporangium sp. NPDC049002 TaxID=3155392 RepID=UPI0033EC26FD